MDFGAFPRMRRGMVIPYLQGIWSSCWPWASLPTRYLFHLLEVASSPESSNPNRLESCLVLCCSVKGELPKLRSKCHPHLMSSTCHCLPATEPGTCLALSKCLLNRSLTRKQEAQDSLWREKAIEKGVNGISYCIFPGSPPPPHSTCLKDTQSTGFVLYSHEVEFRSLVPFASKHSVS